MEHAAPSNTLVPEKPAGLRLDYREQSNGMPLLLKRELNGLKRLLATSYVPADPIGPW
jgi:hypothetical protein